MVRTKAESPFGGRPNGCRSGVCARMVRRAIWRPLSLLVVASLVAATSSASVSRAGASVDGPTVLATITVGVQPWGVAFSPDGTTAYVGNSGGHTISVIDVQTRQVTTVSGGILNFSGPAGVAVTPDGSKVLVTAYLAMTSISMTSSDLQLSGFLTHCVNPLAITMRDDGAAAYIACGDGRIQSVSTDTLAIGSVATGLGQVRDIAYVPRGAQAVDDIAYIENIISGSTGGYFRLHNAGMIVQLPGYGMSIAVNRDGTRAYVGDATGVLSVFDIVNKRLLDTIAVGGDLRGIALSHDGSLAYVTDHDHVGNSLKVVDLVGRSVTHTVAVGAGALRVALSPNGTRALVTNNSAGTVTLLDLPGVTPASASASSPSDHAALLREISCTPDVARAGSTITCVVSGGEGLAGVEILWRAAYNPVIAEAGITLDASGSGEFSFTVPAAALGQPITVELVDWIAPMSLGVAGGPVPTSVPSGGGPVPVWTLGLLALAGVLVLRRGSRSGRSALRVG